MIMRIGPLPDACGRRPDAMDPGFHCVRTHSIRGFMTFGLARHPRNVRLMVPACSELVLGLAV